MSDQTNRTDTRVWQIDNRRVIGQGGISAEGGSNVTVVSNVVDGGAFKFGQQVASDAFRFGNSAFDFGNTALNVNSQVVRDALRAMGNTTDAAMNTSVLSQQSSLAAARYAMDANQATIDAAFAQTGRAFTQAYDAVAGAGNMVAAAYADAKGRGAKTDTMIMLAVCAMGAVALFAVQK